jgi:uncharacterized protein YecE (DUF72 family)
LSIRPLKDHQLICYLRYSIEVRDRTWFQDLTYNFFADINIYIVWSQLAELRSTSPIATTDILYLRFIGDRTIDQKNLKDTKKDIVMEMKNGQ